MTLSHTNICFKKTNNSPSPCQVKHSCFTTTTCPSRNWLQLSMIRRFMTSTKRSCLTISLHLKTKATLNCKNNWLTRARNNNFFSRRSTIKARNTPYASSSMVRASQLPISASTTWRGATSMQKRVRPTMICMSARFATSRSNSSATSRVTFAFTWL